MGTYGGLHPCVITDDLLFNANNLCGTGYNLCDTCLLRSTDVNAGDDNGCTYGGLHPCLITDDFLFNANNLCGTGYNLCDTYLLRSTDVNGCTYGGLHPCVITDDDHGQQLRPLINDYVRRQQAAVMGLHRRFCDASCNVTG